MKKFSLFLCVLLILSMLCSCQSSGSDSGKTSPAANGAGASADPSGNNGSNGNNGGTGRHDILKGLPYTLACKDYYLSDKVIDYTFDDGGRLNDELYRSQDQLENGTGADKQVVFADIRRHRLEITFVSDGKQTGDCLILQNCDIGYFLELEMGPDIDNLTVMEVEQDYETPTGAHITERIKFEPTRIQTVRITLIVQSRTNIALDEIAIIDSKLEATTNSTTPITTNNDSGDDIHSSTGTTPTTPVSRPSSTIPSGGQPTGNGKDSIVGRWTQHVEGDNVEMSALYSFFDDGTGSLITFAGLVTGEITYTYDANNRYTISIKAKLFGQEDSDTGSGYMYVEGDYLRVVTDDNETTTLRRMTDAECAVAAELAEKVGIRF